MKGEGCSTEHMVILTVCIQDQEKHTENGAKNVNKKKEVNEHVQDGQTLPCGSVRS